jgi:hypothetical protein
MDEQAQLLRRLSVADAKTANTFGCHAQVASLMIFRPLSREQRLKALLKPARPSVSGKPAR